MARVGKHSSWGRSVCPEIILETNGMPPVITLVKYRITLEIPWSFLGWDEPSRSDAFPFLVKPGKVGQSWIFSTYTKNTHIHIVYKFKTDIQKTNCVNLFSPSHSLSLSLWYTYASIFGIPKANGGITTFHATDLHSQPFQVLRKVVICPSTFLIAKSIPRVEQPTNVGCSSPTL